MHRGDSALALPAQMPSTSMYRVEPGCNGDGLVVRGVITHARMHVTPSILRARSEAALDVPFDALRRALQAHPEAAHLVAMPYVYCGPPRGDDGAQAQTSVYQVVHRTRSVCEAAAVRAAACAHCRDAHGVFARPLWWVSELPRALFVRIFQANRQPDGAYA